MFSNIVIEINENTFNMKTQNRIPYSIQDKLMYTQLIQEALSHPREFYEQFGTTVVEELEVDDYSLVLFKFTEPQASLVQALGLPVYQLGMERSGLDLTSYEQQMKKFDMKQGIKFSKIILHMKNQIKDWINKYGVLSLSSFNKKKSSQYKNMLEKLGFQTEEKHIYGFDIVMVQ